jgi:hypothetical protein
MKIVSVIEVPSALDEALPHSVHAEEVLSIAKCRLEAPFHAHALRDGASPPAQHLLRANGGVRLKT